MKFSIEQFNGFTDPLEGSVSWMYLDRIGKVTTARGYLIDSIQDACACPWVGDPHPDVVAAEWARVKNSGMAGEGGGNQRAGKTLFLSPEGVDALTLQRLWGNETRLATLFSNWAQLPLSAQLAIHSMCWAEGESELEHDWPKFVTAVSAGDFETAATQSQMRNPANDASLSRRNKANASLLRVSGHDDWPDGCFTPAFLQHLATNGLAIYPS